DEQNMIFDGCAAIRDKPRKEAFEAVKKCRRAGIKPVMITGDNKETARAIAKELKIYNDGDDILTGAELEKISDNVLKEKIKNVSVFARVSPADKLRIVKAFKAKGEVVAMTGDGVNDAPAVKQADIGIAMGISGTDVTKEASSMILSDDNFSTIVLAVEEGRIIYNNIRRFIRYLLSCNIGEVLTMFLSMMFNMPLVLRPIHILLINLVTDGLPAIALGLEPGEENIMNKKPRNPSSGIFSDGLLFKIISRGAIIGLCTIAAFISTVKITGDLLTAQSAAFYTLVLTQLIHSFECKSEDKSLFKINLLSNKKLLFAVLFSLVVTISVIFVPSLNVIFKTVPLPINVLFLITGYSFFGAVISAIFKKK
ncbi:MAG: HAD-IC family P-type ATPase, partial [Oscillospiraceae bacterium]